MFGGCELGFALSLWVCVLMDLLDGLGCVGWVAGVRWIWWFLILVFGEFHVSGRWFSG